ncbi:gp53-like domain-containing protein [Escherichia coli]|uniref:gp53-like domain-containing protein n=1 Tax=Escherichia coli TaxID=562 RepID=UPI003F4BDFB3
MHRIDTKTAQKDKFGAGKNGFTRGNPKTGTPATDLDDDYFDMLQEELCSVVEASGASLEKGRHDQLLTALRALLLSRKNPFGDIKSDGTVKTALENLGLGDSVLLSQFSSLRNGSGYRKLPDGTIKMWGIAITSSLAAGAGGAWSVSLPTAFPNAMLSASASLAMGASAGGMWVSVMDVGTPFNGTTDTKLPASKQTTIYGAVFNGLANSTKALIRWECEGY